MCVISLNEFIRPTDEQVCQMFDSNNRGGGAAWREIVDGKPIVRWKKGLDKEEMLKLSRELPFPYVLHFRIPSVGTSTSAYACHPFGIDEEANESLEGTTEGYVLFHNGMWGGWKEKMQQIAIHGYVRVPSGAWSDSRGLAWAAHHLGLGFLELVDEKCIAFGPNDGDIEQFGGFYQVKQMDTDGIEKCFLVSNRAWEKVVHHSPTLALGSGAKNGMAGAGTEGTGGSSHQPSFCLPQPRLTAAIREEGAEQESVQKEDEGFERGDVEGVEAGYSALRASCVKCGKYALIAASINGQNFCWQCWSLERPVDKPKIGTCQYCRAGYAGARRYDNDKWICSACHDTNGRPRVYWAREYERIVGERIADQMRGV